MTRVRKLKSVVSVKNTDYKAGFAQARAASRPRAVGCLSRRAEAPRQLAEIKMRF